MTAIMISKSRIAGQRHATTALICILSIVSPSLVPCFAGVGTKAKPTGVIIHNLRPYDPPEFYEFYTVDRGRLALNYILIKEGREIRVDIDRFTFQVPYTETRSSWLPDQIAAAKNSIDEATKRFPQFKQQLEQVKLRWLKYETSLAKATPPAPSSSDAITNRSGQESEERINTLSGAVYDRAIVTSVEPDGITVTHSAGVVKILFTDLPIEMRQKYHYDQAKAVAYATHQAQVQTAYANQIAAAAAKQTEDNRRAAQQASEQERVNSEVSKIALSPLQLRTTSIVRITKGGVVMEGMNASDVHGQVILSTDEFFLAGIDSTNMTDHQQLQGHLTIYRAGVYTDGVSTIARYATSPELAYKLVKDDKKRNAADD